MEENKNGNRPAFVVQKGKVRVAVFSNQLKGRNGQPYEQLKATVSVRYFDGKEWKTSQSIGKEEVPLVILALSRAYDWMVTSKNEDGATEEVAPSQRGE